MLRSGYLAAVVYRPCDNTTRMIKRNPMTKFTTSDMWNCLDHLDYSTELEASCMRLEIDDLTNEMCRVT